MIYSKSVIIDNLKITYYSSSDDLAGKNVIYLHGWGSHAMHFKKFIEKNEKIIAVDLPGFGNSDKPKADWGLDEYASFLNSFLKKVNIENSIIVGHSFGGSVAIRFCSQYQSASKLILIDSAGIREKTLKKAIYFIIAKIAGLIFYLPIPSKVKKHVRRYFYKLIGLEDYINAGEMAAIYRKIISQDVKENLKNIKIYVCLIWGENDTDTPVDNAKKMHSLLPNSRLRIIPNAGHFVFLDNEVEFEKIFFEAIQ